jgi:predicted Zn-dependent protease
MNRPSANPQQELQLLTALPEEWLMACWAAQPEPLQQLVQRLMAQVPLEVVPEQWLGFALALATAGQPKLADDLVLELDARHPELGLVPDHWGLWPQAGEPGPLAAVVRHWLAWRHGEQAEAVPGLLTLWRQQLGGAELEAPDGWRRLMEPAAVAQLALLLAPAGAAERLRAELEPPLVEAMGEAVVERHPQEALQFWSGISQRCPSWDYARLKTADLCLQSGHWQRSATALAAATEEQRRNPWLHDIEARLAMAQGLPADALRCWEEAINAASGDGELVELLRQRRREAEWEVELVGEPQLSGPSGDADLDRFAARLEDLAQRFGVLLPQGGAAGGARDAEGFAAFLDKASGRLALAG